MNCYRFKIQASKKMNLWVGMQQTEPRYEWWVRLNDGKKFDSGDNAWSDYTDYKFKPGDIVEMTSNGENVSFSVNDKPLGNAFADRRLAGENIFACVFIVDGGDFVHALKGSVVTEDV